MKKTSILGGALILMLVTAGCAPAAPASGQSETTAASNTDTEAAVPERTAEAGSEAAQATAANHTEAAASEYTGEADAGNAVMSSTENAGAAEAESAENTEGAEIVGQSYGTVDYDMVGEAVEGMKLTPNDELELVSARRVGPQFRIELRRLQPATGETEFGTSENIRTWEEGSLLNFTFWNKENLSELPIRTAKGEYLLSVFPKLAMEEIPLNASGENFTLQSMTRYDSAVTLHLKVEKNAIKSFFRDRPIRKFTLELADGSVMIMYDVALMKEYHKTGGIEILYLVDKKESVGLDGAIKVLYEGKPMAVVE